MKRYEYTTVTVKPGGWFRNDISPEFQDALNRYGAQGWRLAACFPLSGSLSGGATSNLVAVFEREIE